MNGQEAIDQILLEPRNLSNDGRKSKFDLIFLDLHMPILDGF
jgi:CheY-like chemotaxis protein